MKFINSAIALTLTIAGLSQASPIQSRAALKNFQLKTKVIPGHKDCGSDKNGLYIFSYHTGAGLGIAAGLNESMTSYFYINETTQGLSWTYPENEIGPWPVEIEYGPYQSYVPLSISIAGDYSDIANFSLSSNNILNLTQSSGFVMCDSWYSSPQLFVISEGYENVDIPTSCSNVELEAVPTVTATATTTASA